MQISENLIGVRGFGQRRKSRLNKECSSRRQANKKGRNRLVPALLNMFRLGAWQQTLLELVANLREGVRQVGAEAAHGSDCCNSD